MKQLSNTKIFKLIMVVLVNIFLFEGCGTNRTSPLISILKITDVDGGSVVSYGLSNTDSVAYVLARYAINNETVREVQSPVNLRNVTLSGFKKSGGYAVELYTVTTSGQLSEPLSIMVHPHRPTYLRARDLLTLQPDFGGFNIKADRRFLNMIGITLLSYDSTGKAPSIKDQHFFKNEPINYTVRNLLPVTGKVGVFVSDIFGNNSDTIICNKPSYPEVMLEKSKFKPYPLASDTENGYNWFLPYLWDGHTDGSSSGWHTNPAKKLPILCSFNLGTNAVLTHFVLWERPDEYRYTAGNPKEFSIWGSAKPAPGDTDIPVNSTVGTIKGDWVNLGNYSYPSPPSGSKPGTTVAADNAFVKAGVSFNIQLKDQPVTVIRLAIASTWSGLNYAHLMELSLYSEPTGFSVHY